MTTTVSLKPVSVGTEIVIVQESVPAAIPVAACYLGWQQSLNHLATLVEPQTGTKRRLRVMQLPGTLAHLPSNFARCESARDRDLHRCKQCSGSNECGARNTLVLIS
jgi:hypothetical protein